jgi:hypothetical protein
MQLRRLVAHWGGCTVGSHLQVFYLLFLSSFPTEIHDLPRSYFFPIVPAAGQSDGLVSCDWGRATSERLASQLGPEAIAFQAFPQVDHELDAGMLQRLLDWLLHGPMAPPGALPPAASAPPPQLPSVPFTLEAVPGGDSKATFTVPTGR